MGAPAQKQEDFAFIQISDSHIGFDRAANPDATQHAEATTRAWEGFRTCFNERSATVAQSAERQFCKLRVGGSIPSGGSNTWL